VILGFWASVEVLWIGAILRRRRLGTMTYYVALAFKRSEENGDIVACEPKEARSADRAIRMAGSLAAGGRTLWGHRVLADGRPGAIAFSRTGDPALGEFEDAVILKTVGEVDVGLLTV
jgi:hypothetical protein